MGQLPPLCGQHGNAQALGAYAEGTHDALQIASLPDLAQLNARRRHPETLRPRPQ